MWASADSRLRALLGIKYYGKKTRPLRKYTRTDFKPKLQWHQELDYGVRHWRKLNSTGTGTRDGILTQSLLPFVKWYVSSPSVSLLSSYFPNTPVRGKCVARWSKLEMPGLGSAHCSANLPRAATEAPLPPAAMYSSVSSGRNFVDYPLFVLHEGHLAVCCSW